MTAKAPWRVLPPAFFRRDVESVARDLLGKGLLVLPPHSREPLLAELSEVEAYAGAVDPASHTFRGETARNRSMFQGGGTFYVYLIYGLHFCMNIVTGEKGSGQAVLLRAARPLLGLEALASNRGLPPTAKAKPLMGGPGKLAQAFGIDRRFDGLTSSKASGIAIVEINAKAFPEITLGGSVQATPRIGISKAVDWPYRWLYSE